MDHLNSLDRPAQLRLLEPIARRALDEYAIDQFSLHPLQLVQNATWKVQCLRKGRRYLLRIHPSQRHDVATIQSELLWLEALNKQEFTVPTPVRTRNGELFTIPCAEGVPEPRICTLLTWVPGRLVGQRRSTAVLRSIGELMARLHEQARGFHLPPSFVRPRWNQAGLFGDRSDKEKGWKRLTSRQERLFGKVAERLAPILNGLGAGRDVFGLIHGDLTFPNVIIHRGKACAIDFDDCGFGYFLYDIAIVLDRIEMRPDYEVLSAALLEGYRRVRTLAAEHTELLELFLLARWVHLGLCFLSRPEFRDYSPRFMSIVEPKIEHYLKLQRKKVARFQSRYPMSEWGSEENL